MDINSKYKMNNGIEIPVFGLGTYQSRPGIETRTAVSYALEIGCRLIDTASMYMNEADIGYCLKQTDIPRSEIFITTKVWNSQQGYDSTLRAFNESFRKLGSDDIDLYLIHWPVPEYRKATWKAMEKIYESKVVRSIGVSNYTIRHLEEMKNYANIPPAINQVEFSPFTYQKELLEYCKKNNIILEAYSPLTRGKKFNDRELKDIAAKYKRTPAQILIRWALQVGTVVIPKSVHKERIKENSEVFDFNITDEDMRKIETLNENFRPGWNPERMP